MPLENLTGMLRLAQDGSYAVGAFNILDYNSMKAAVTAAQALESPVIIQTSAKTVLYWSCKTLVAWMSEILTGVDIPVALHLDHCKDLNLIGACIEAGWTSAMIDASSKPFEDNLSLTRQVVEMARPAGVTVEAELGEIAGVEDDIVNQEETLADPDRAVSFCESVELDCFAPAIGTAHGIYKGEPRIAFDRLREIAERTGVPVALHGGTGLSEEVFRKCISLGCAKINISTQLKHAFIDAFLQYHCSHGAQYDPLKTLACQFDAVRQVVAAHITQFGSAGKAR